MITRYNVVALAFLIFAAQMKKKTGSIIGSQIALNEKSIFFDNVRLKLRLGDFVRDSLGSHSSSRCKYMLKKHET